MSYITALDDTAIENYVKLTEGGKGDALVSSLDTLMSLYQNSTRSVFGPDDQSSAREAAELLLNRITEIKNLLDDTDDMIDGLVTRIQTDIIDAENNMASRIASEG